MSFSLADKNNTTTSLNNIPIEAGPPLDGEFLVYKSNTDQWMFETASSTSQATATSVGTIQLAGDLSGTATAPLIKQYPSDMTKYISNFTFLGQDQTGATRAVPIAYGINKVGPFDFIPAIIPPGASKSIALKSSKPFTAHGAGLVTIYQGNVPVILATLPGVQITTSYKTLTQISNPVTSGTLENDSEQWKIFLQNGIESYYLELWYFNNAQTPTVFGTLYGVTT